MVNSSTSNVLINESSLAIANTAVTKARAVVTYTGNGTTQAITTGISSVDFTVSANGSGYWHDRTAGDCTVKDDAGNIVASGSCVVNTSKVHIKCRSAAQHNIITDGLRGTSKAIVTNLTDAEGNADRVTSFTNTGIVLSETGYYYDCNVSAATYIAYQDLYTHIKWGLTSQGKRYIEAYNPVTRQGMIMYQGSGVAGHQIPHSMGVAIDYMEMKNLNTTLNWAGQYPSLGDISRFHIDVSNGFYTKDTYFGTHSISNINVSTATIVNALDQSHIAYYKCNSETFTIGTYTGTGVAGNKVVTTDVNGKEVKLRDLVVKRIDAVGDWVFEGLPSSGGNNRLELNTSDAEDSTTFGGWYFTTNGFEPRYQGELNTANGQYLYYGNIDTNATITPDDSYFNLPTDNSNLNITGGTFTYSDGVTTNGYNRKSKQITEAIDFTGVTDGLKWVGNKLDGSGYVFEDNKPIIQTTVPTGTLTSYTFCTETGLWYDLTSTAVTTPLGFLPNPIMVASETPMDIRQDDKLLTNVMDSLESGIIKCNDYQGKNACTAWVNFDGTTTPPTIRDSFNVKDVVDLGYGGEMEIVLENSFINSNFSVSGSGSISGINPSIFVCSGKTISSVRVKLVQYGVGQLKDNNTNVMIFGGK